MTVSYNVSSELNTATSHWQERLSTSSYSSFICLYYCYCRYFVWLALHCLRDGQHWLREGRIEAEQSTNICSVCTERNGRNEITWYINACLQLSRAKSRKEVCSYSFSSQFPPRSQWSFGRMLVVNIKHTYQQQVKILVSLPKLMRLPCYHLPPKYLFSTLLLIYS